MLQVDSSAGWPSLPLDVLADVLQYLDLVSAMRASVLVCESWRRITAMSPVAERHLWKPLSERLSWSPDTPCPYGPREDEGGSSGGGSNVEVKEFVGQNCYSSSYRCAALRLGKTSIETIFNLTKLSWDGDYSNPVQVYAELCKLPPTDVLPLLSHLSTAHDPTRSQGEQTEAQKALRCLLPSTEGLQQEVGLQYNASMLEGLKAKESACQAWQELIASGCRDPLEGMLVLARWRSPLLNEKSVRSEMSRMVDMVCSRCSEEVIARPHADNNPFAILEAVNQVMFKDLGFAGADQGNYYREENSYIDAILQTRRGIPISLSCIYQAVCRGVGLRLDAIGMPGHFLLALRPRGQGVGAGASVAGYDDDEGHDAYGEDWGETEEDAVEEDRRVFIDVYSQGVHLTRADCVRMIAAMRVAQPQHPRHVAPVRSREIWSRSLRNLKAQPIRRHDPLWDYSVTSQIQVLAGSHNTQHRLDLCHLADTLHLHAEAREHLRALQQLRDVPFPMDFAPSFWHAMIRELSARLSAPGPDRGSVVRRGFGPGPRFHVGQLLMEKASGKRGVVVGWEAGRTAATGAARYKMKVLVEGPRGLVINVPETDCRASASWFTEGEALYASLGTRPLEFASTLGKYMVRRCLPDVYLPNEFLSAEYPDDTALVHAKMEAKGVAGHWLSKAKPATGKLKVA